MARWRWVQKNRDGARTCVIRSAGIDPQNHAIISAMPQQPAAKLCGERITQEQGEWETRRR